VLEYLNTTGIKVEYDYQRRLVFRTLGEDAVKGKKERKDGEMRSNQIFEEEIKKKLKELRLPREAPAKSVTFKSDHKQLLQEFKNLIATKKIVWRGRRDVRTGSQDLSDQTLEKNCIAFIQTLSAGGGGSGDAISTKVLYDLESFLEKICCTKSSRDNDYLAASTLSLRLHAVRNVVNKHPDIPIGANDKNTLYRQYEALGEITAIVDRVVTGIKERRFKNNYFDFDYDDVLDAILKIYDGRLALEERRLICEFGSRSELSSIVLVHNPKEKKEGVVEDLLKDWCGVIVIESKSPIDEKKNYSDIENALPEGLKISIRKRRFIKKDTETRTIFTLAGEQDQTIARILLGIYVAETKQDSSSRFVVHLLKALDKRSFDGKYSWPYRIFRLIQEFGCRDDLGTIQFACNPTEAQMKKFDEEQANLLIITTKDGEDLPAHVNFLREAVFPEGIKVSVSLMAHKTAAVYSLTPVREIESEDVKRMVIDIFLTERTSEDVNRPFFLIPRVARLVKVRKGANFKMTYMVSSVLKKLKFGDRKVKEKYKSTIFLRKLLASSKFHNARVREFICSDGSEIEKLRDPPTIDGVSLNANAFKMYHSLRTHLEYYLRLICKAWKAKVDLAAHYDDDEITQIRSKWNTYLENALKRLKNLPEDGENNRGKPYSPDEIKFILGCCEEAYLDSPNPPLCELEGKVKNTRLLALFKIMNERKRNKNVNETGLTKQNLHKEISRKLEENFPTKPTRTETAIKLAINQREILEPFCNIREGFLSLLANERECAIGIKNTIIPRNELWRGGGADMVRRAKARL
jgi:hypothetical protein